MRVVLIGGPLDGQEKDVKPTDLRRTFLWQTDEVHAVEWGSLWVQVTPTALADYARWPDGSWRHVRTQLTIGDTEIEEDQLTLEEGRG